MNRRTEGTANRMTSQDFMLGILNAASERDPALLLSDRDHKIDTAFHAAYQVLTRKVDEGKVDDIHLGFVVQPDRYYGDSETVQTGMTFLYSLGYIARLGSSRYYRFEPNHGQTHAEVFEKIPTGSPELFRDLAAVFLSTLQADNS